MNADLDRFVVAQDPVLDTVRAELDAGAKRTHWMWFVFPQLAALGRSATARHFGLADLDEARAYAAHPVLGPRLRDAAARLLALPPGTDIHHVLGSPDDLKLRSCMTLFERADPGHPAWAAVLDRFHGGRRDDLTRVLLEQAAGARPPRPADRR